MKRSIFILLAVLLSAVLVLGSTLSANAKATRVEVSYFEYDCANTWEADWMEGLVWHIHNYVHTNRNASYSPEPNGVKTTVADAEFNFATGDVVIRGKTSWKPDKIEGTLEGSWTFTSNVGVTRGYAMVQGTGGLFGRTLYCLSGESEGPAKPVGKGGPLEVSP